MTYVIEQTQIEIVQYTICFVYLCQCTVWCPLMESLFEFRGSKENVTGDTF